GIDVRSKPDVVGERFFDRLGTFIGPLWPDFDHSAQAAHRSLADDDLVQIGNAIDFFLVTNVDVTVETCLELSALFLARADLDQLLQVRGINLPREVARDP